MQIVRIAPAIAEQAVQWWIALKANDADSGVQHARLQRWRDADPTHEAAWQRIESVGGRLAGIPTPLARAALSAAPQSMRRRRSVQLLSALVVAGGTTLVARQSTPWRAWTADQVSAIGERRTLRLPDGGELMLNTGSAVNIRFDAERRVLQLVRGEILVQTAADAMQRPFLVQTAAGTARALGTRFTVRQRDDASVDVGVLQGAVALQPLDAGAPGHTLQAGETGRFTRTQAMAAGPLNAHANAWIDGMLVASHMRLADFLAELGRYRPGRLGCDPAIAGLEVSGAYPLDDTDRVLTALTSSLPVEIHTYTRYWVSVGLRRRRGTIRSARNDTAKK
ncbi:MAG: FecR domain-containing protein [Pseudomonadota bacterium]